MFHLLSLWGKKVSLNYVTELNDSGYRIQQVVLTNSDAHKHISVPLLVEKFTFLGMNQ